MRIRLFIRRNRAISLACGLCWLAALGVLCTGQWRLALFVLLLPVLVAEYYFRIKSELTVAPVSWEQKQLGLKQGPAALGANALILAMGVDDRERRAAQEALLKELPFLRAPVYERFDESQREALRMLCAETRDAELAVLLLEAYEWVEDVEALPHVLRVADGRGKVGRARRVLEAARHCVRFLEAVQRERRDASTLLRPAMPDGSRLLRPAGGTPTTPDSQLLRPVLGADDERGP